MNIFELFQYIKANCLPRNNRSVFIPSSQYKKLLFKKEFMIGTWVDCSVIYIITMLWMDFSTIYLIKTGICLVHAMHQVHA